MKKILRYQHRYNKESNNANLYISLIFSGILLIIANSKEINLTILKIFLTAFISIIFYLNLRVSYLDDLYYSQLVNENESIREKHHDTYMKIKNEETSWIKRFFLSYFCLGAYNTISNLVSLILITAILVFMWVF